jgi:Ca2+/H+ antiporter, TMEM165/GDT1 family
MFDVGVICAAFAITFLAELPDKSLFASLVLGTRYRPVHVWVGTAVAFAVHMAIAVAAGQVLAAFVPPRLKDAGVAALFIAGAIYLLVTSFRPDRDESRDKARQGNPPSSAMRVTGISFAIAFLAEWGDITQITTANLAARYADPLSVFIGATLGMWVVAALAVSLGAKSLAVIPMAWVRRISAAILFGFGAYSAIAAVAG